MKTEGKITQSATGHGVQFFISSSAIVAVSHKTPERVHIALPISLQKEKHADGDIATLLHTFKKAVHEARGVFGNVEYATIICSVPWCISETATLDYTRMSEFVVSQDILEGIIQTELARREHKNKKKGQNMRILEIQPTQVKLNGYSTTRPLGQRARRIAIEVVISSLGANVYKELLHDIVSTFHIPESKINIQAMLDGYRKFLHDAQTPITTGIGVNYDGEYTQIFLMREGGVQMTSVIPIGFHDLLRSLAAAVGADIVTARSLLGMYNQKVLRESDQAIVVHIIKKHKDEFLRQLAYVLSQIDHGEYSVPMPLLYIQDLMWGNECVPTGEESILLQDFSGAQLSGVVAINRTDIYNYMY